MRITIIEHLQTMRGNDDGDGGGGGGKWNEWHSIELILGLEW